LRVKKLEFTYPNGEPRRIEVVPGPVSGDFYVFERFFSGGDLTNMRRITQNLQEVWVQTYKFDIFLHTIQLTHDETLIVSSLPFRSYFEIFNASNGELLHAVFTLYIDAELNRLYLSPESTRMYYTALDIWQK
jgi:hypothetical protein